MTPLHWWEGEDIWVIYIDFESVLQDKIRRDKIRCLTQPCGHEPGIALNLVGYSLESIQMYSLLRLYNQEY